MNLNGLHRKATTYERPIYGSSRLGIMNKAVKSQKSAVCSLPSFYLFLTDYYPFGYPISFRTHSTGYRYGFNGQEGDNEIYGDNLNYAFQYRMYDARIGRFWSVDPLKSDYPWNSTYAFAENSPIWARDLEGLEKKNYLEHFFYNQYRPLMKKVSYKIFRSKIYNPLKKLYDGNIDDNKIQEEANRLNSKYQNSAWYRFAAISYHYDVMSNEEYSEKTDNFFDLDITLNVFTQNKPNFYKNERESDDDKSKTYRVINDYFANSGATLIITFDPKQVANKIEIFTEKENQDPVLIYSTDFIENPSGDILDIKPVEILINDKNCGRIFITIHNTKDYIQDKWEIKIEQTYPKKFNPIQLYKTPK